MSAYAQLVSAWNSRRWKSCRDCIFTIKTHFPSLTLKVKQLVSLACFLELIRGISYNLEGLFAEANGPLKDLVSAPMTAISHANFSDDVELSLIRATAQVQAVLWLIDNEIHRGNTQSAKTTKRTLFQLTEEDEAKYPMYRDWWGEFADDEVRPFSEDNLGDVRDNLARNLNPFVEVARERYFSRRLESGNYLQLSQIFDISGTRVSMGALTDILLSHSAGLRSYNIVTHVSGIRQEKGHGCNRTWQFSRLKLPPVDCANLVETLFTDGSLAIARQTFKDCDEVEYRLGSATERVKRTSCRDCNGEILNFFPDDLDPRNCVYFPIGNVICSTGDGPRLPQLGRIERLYEDTCL